MPKLYLIRHAEPELTGVLLGRCDPPLSAAGRLAAAHIQIAPSMLYTSSLKRARETADHMTVEKGAVVLGDLDEISYGSWDGLAWSDIESIYPDLAARKLADWRNVTPPGGEDWLHFETRVERALQVISSNLLPAAVVAHITVNGKLAELLTGKDALLFRQEYCQVLPYDL